MENEGLEQKKDEAFNAVKLAPVDSLVMAVDGFIEVVCIAFPNGDNLWFDAEKGHDYMRTVIGKWKADHPEFTDNRCSMGAVHITMPLDRFKALNVWP